MKKVAIPHWQGRVSPVFDVASNLLVVEIDGGAEHCRRDVAFDNDQPRQRVARLVEAGANVLICGAISKPLELAVAAAGIEVFPHTCGEVECVLQAFCNGRLRQGEFLMPGCCGRRRRRNGCRHGGC